VATRDLDGIPLYIVPEFRLTPEQGGNSACYAYTASSMDLYHQKVIGDQWTGRGACIVVNDTELRRLVPSDTQLEKAIKAKVLHELAHILEWPSPYKPRPDADRATIRREAAKVGKEVSRHLTPKERRKPWLGHEARFIRIAMHLRYRAERAGVYIISSMVHRAEDYELSPTIRYVQALGDEPERMMDATIHEICATKPSEAFILRWKCDLIRWAKSLPRTEKESV